MAETIPAISSLLSPSMLAELRRVELRTRRNIDSDLMGRYRTAFRGSGLVYSDLREYQPGDEVKNIHWKATARTGKVYVKSYEEERQLNIMIAVDTSASTDFGRAKSKHTKALEFAALITMLAQRSQDAVGLCLFSDKVEEYFPPKRSRTQLFRILFELLRARTLRPGTDIAGALDYIRSHQRKPAIIFLVSDFFSAPFESQLRYLSISHDLVCVALVDIQDRELPSVGIVEFVDAESGERILFDTSQRRARETLQRMQLERLEELNTLCKRLGADLIRVDENPLRPLAELMQRRMARLR